MDYIISDKKDDKSLYFDSCDDFLAWFLDVKPLDKSFKFIGADNIRNLYLFLVYYFTIKKDIENEIDHYNSSLEDDNYFINEALEQFISSNSGGKYLRAVLVSLGYHTFGKTDNYYLPLAISLEVFQTSILIHDDIIDKSDVRRGEDTIPVKYQKKYNGYVLDDVSNSMALCLGDLGFYLANQILINNYSRCPYFSSLLEYYNNTAIRTCKGEMVDVMLPFYEKNIGDIDKLEDNILLIYKLKTAWYSVVGPFVLGSILGGISLSEIKNLEDSLIGLGIAYQIKDDLLGIYGDEQAIGKSIYSDAEEFKQTILYSYVVNTEYKDEFLKYYGKKMDSISLHKIRKIFDDSGAKKYASVKMDKLFDECCEKIIKLRINDDYKNLLLGFCEFLKCRRK